MANEERNIKHECAEYAYQSVEDIINLNNEDIQKKYRSEVMSTGARIKGSGLMQTLAFYSSKDEPHFLKLTLHLLKWILKDEQVNGKSLNTEKWDEDKEQTMKIFSFLLNKTDGEMIYYTQMALDVTEWLKRFSDARLKE